VLDGLRHFHLGDTLQEFGHQALVVGIEVLDHNERHAAVVGHVRQKLLQRFQSARRGADTDDGMRTFGRNIFFVRRIVHVAWAPGCRFLG